MARRGCAIAGAIALGLAARGARAEGPLRPVPADAIAWHAPPECGDVAALQVRMAAYLDGPVAPGWFAEVEITPIASAYQGEARIGHAPKIVTRRVVGRDCAEVIDALGLVLGLSAQSAAATTPPPPPPPPVVAPTIAPDPPAPLTAYVRGAAFGDLGTVPLGALGAGLGAGFAVGPWGTRIGAIWMPARFARIADTEVGLDVGLLAGQLAGCRRALAGVWLCAGLELGGMRGDPVGLVDGAPTRRAWFAADLTVSRTIALTDRTSLVGAVEGIGALLRPRFVLDDGTEVFVPSSIAGRAMIGLEIRLR